MITSIPVDLSVARAGIEVLRGSFTWVRFHEVPNSFEVELNTNAGARFPVSQPFTVRLEEGIQVIYLTNVASAGNLILLCGDSGDCPTDFLGSALAPLQARALGEWYGVHVLPGGVGGSGTAPIDPRYPGLALGWALGQAGVGGAAVNEDDNALGYAGWRLRSAPNAQNNAFLGSNDNQSPYPQLMNFLSSPQDNGTAFLETQADVRVAGAGGERFVFWIPLAANFTAPGGYLGFRAARDVVGGAISNWTLGFLSGQAAYNFPAVAPSRSVDLGVASLNNPVQLRLEAGQGMVRAYINRVLRGIISFQTVPLTNAERDVLHGNNARWGPKIVIQGEASATDTRDLWISPRGYGIFAGWVPPRSVILP